MIVIRECDWSVLIVICKMPHKMNYSNPSQENDKKYDIMQRTGNES